MSNVKGYIFSRSFFEERVPQHVQNIVIKDFCNKNNLNFMMSATEYSTQNTYFILFELIKNIKKIDGLVFYSLFQLPENENKRKIILNKILKNKKKIFFAVENLSIVNTKDILKIENIIKIKKNFEISKPKELFNLVTINHVKTKRNYIERMKNEKVLCMKKSKKYDFDYWDGDRKFGYGGYKYIKDYFKELALELIKKYSLNNKSKILDIGCGKGYLLYEIKKILKKIEIVGIDSSNYAIKNSKKEIKKYLVKKNITHGLKFKENYFDLVLSINTLHNLKLNELEISIKEIERLGKNKFICVESYRNELEQFNLQCWALTAETIMDTSSWKWLLKTCSYTGNYEFIYFN